MLEGLLLIDDIGVLNYAVNETSMKNQRRNCGPNLAKRGFERLINSTYLYRYISHASILNFKDCLNSDWVSITKRWYKLSKSDVVHIDIIEHC